MQLTQDIAIIGGGAAGLASAIFAARAGARVRVLDSAKILGAKILVSGGGRCNVTNQRITPADYNGPKNLVKNILAAFDQEKTVDWFNEIGVPLKLEDTGKLFPTSDSAKTVLSALLSECEKLRVTIETGHRVNSIEPLGDGFLLRHPTGQTLADRIILATGGKSLPKTGSDGNGYSLAQSLGHTLTPTFPALVPLLLSPEFFHTDISGLAAEVELTTLIDNQPTDRRTGAILFTHFGISGPVAMDASRHFASAQHHSQPTELLCNFLPGRTPQQIESHLLTLTTNRPRSTIANAINDLLPSRLAEALAKHAGIPQFTTMSQLTKPQRRAFIKTLISTPLPVTDVRGWNYAEVTAGGVPLQEINFRTMQSRLHPHLYLAGEILDVDGRIGGFNFQWAWSTGYLAGTHAARP